MHIKFLNHIIYICHVYICKSETFESKLSTFVEQHAEITIMGKWNIFGIQILILHQNLLIRDN